MIIRDEVKIPAQLVLSVKKDIGTGEQKIVQVMVELGHHMYAKVDFNTITEEFWQELWRWVEMKENKEEKDEML